MRAFHLIAPPFNRSEIAAISFSLRAHLTPWTNVSARLDAENVPPSYPTPAECEKHALLLQSNPSDEDFHVTSYTYNHFGMPVNNLLSFLRRPPQKNVTKRINNEQQL